MYYNLIVEELANFFQGKIASFCNGEVNNNRRDDVASNKDEVHLPTNVVECGC